MILLVAGMLTVVVILVSHSVSIPQAQSAEKHSDKKHSTVLIQAPADVVISPSIELVDQVPAVLPPAQPAERQSKPALTIARILSPYLAILFRAIISPNAP